MKVEMVDTVKRRPVKGKPAKEVVIDNEVYPLPTSIP